jgi:hypothetical protein
MMVAYKKLQAHKRFVIFFSELKFRTALLRYINRLYLKAAGSIPASVKN